MLAFPSERSRSDDESIFTTESSITVTSDRYLAPHLNGFSRSASASKVRGQFSGAYLQTPFAQPGLVDREYVHAHSSFLATISDDYLDSFLMPLSRNTDGAKPKSRPPRSMMPELKVIDSDMMEAAWEDESCVDGSSPHLEPHESDSVEDRFEMEALRRQVEQLQLALQLQSQQLALLESQAQHRPRAASARSSQILQQQAAVNDIDSSTHLPSPSTHHPPPLMTQRSISRAPSTWLRSSKLPPAHLATAPTRELPPTPTVHHPFADRSSPRPSSSLTDPDRLEHLDRKVAVLEQLLEALNSQTHPATSPNPISSPSPTTSSLTTLCTNASTPDSASAFHFNPTPPAPISNTAKFTTNMFRVKKAATVSSSGKSSFSASSIRSVDIEAQAESTTRVSWSRKRTEKVAQPKAKVRQGPGRGRMVIRETAA